jgi:hypothetical protein
MQKFCAPPNGGLLTYLVIKEKIMTTFVYISNEKLIEFFEYKEQHPTLKQCDVYVDKSEDKIFFVENIPYSPRENVRVCEDYSDDVIIFDSHKPKIQTKIVN